MTDIKLPPGRHQIVPAAYLLIVRSGKILLQRRFHTGFEDGNYGLVSGHVEKGETFTQALIREVAEEVGITVKSEDLEIVHISHRKSYDSKKGESERVDVFFKAQKWKGKLENKEPHKCDDLSWFSKDNLPQNTIAYIRHMLSEIENKVFYSEYGWIDPPSLKQ